MEKARQEIGLPRTLSTCFRSRGIPDGMKKEANTVCRYWRKPMRGRISPFSYIACSEKCRDVWQFPLWSSRTGSFFWTSAFQYPVVKFLHGRAVVVSVSARSPEVSDLQLERPWSPHWPCALLHSGVRARCRATNSSQRPEGLGCQHGWSTSPNACWFFLQSYQLVSCPINSFTFRVFCARFSKTV